MIARIGSKVQGSRVQRFGVHRSGLYGVNTGICFGYLDPKLTLYIVTDSLTLQLDLSYQFKWRNYALVQMLITNL